jgi:hypothetical protein
MKYGIDLQQFMVDLEKVSNIVESKLTGSLWSNIEEGKLTGSLWSNIEKDKKSLEHHNTTLVGNNLIYKRNSGRLQYFEEKFDNIIKMTCYLMVDGNCQVCCYCCCY